MIRDTEVLTEIMGDTKTRTKDNMILEKYFPGGRMVMVGSNSPSGVSSKPMRVVLADEIDRYEPTKEGDVIDLARKRMATFFNSLLFLTTTPSTKDLSKIESWWEISDKRKFFVPCGGCSELMVLRWSRETVIWDRDEAGNHLPETAKYCCEHCGVLLSDLELNKMIQKGRWIATAPFNGIAGFGELPEFYSPWKRLVDTVKDFLDAQGDDEKLKVWVNTSLGQLWEIRNQRMEPNFIYERREQYGMVVPMEAAFITAGIDVQENRIEVYTKAWGRNEESWALEHVAFFGSPAIMTSEVMNPEQNGLFGKYADDQTNIWSQVDQFLQKTYEHASGVRLNISCTAIDTGYLADQVYAFIRPREKRGICAVKGSSEKQNPIISNPSRNNKGKVNLYNVGIFAAKELLMERLFIEASGPGCHHYPDRFNFEFFEQLTSEKKVITVRNNQKIISWVKIRPRNEAWDLEVYNLAALRIGCPSREVLNNLVDFMYAKKREIEDHIPAPAFNKARRQRRVISSGVQL